jgi:hypothetical protein
MLRVGDILEVYNIHTNEIYAKFKIFEIRNGCVYDKCISTCNENLFTVGIKDETAIESYEEMLKKSWSIGKEKVCGRIINKFTEHKQRMLDAGR